MKKTAIVAILIMWVTASFGAAQCCRRFRVEGSLDVNWPGAPWTWGIYSNSPPPLGPGSVLFGAVGPGDVAVLPADAGIIAQEWVESINLMGVSMGSQFSARYIGQDLMDGSGIFEVNGNDAFTFTLGFCVVPGLQRCIYASSDPQLLSGFNVTEIPLVGFGHEIRCRPLPGGGGTVDVKIWGGEAGEPFILLFSFANAGAAPGGPLYGINPTPTEIDEAINWPGAPFNGTLSGCGEAFFSFPVPACPINVLMDSVVVSLDSAGGLIASTALTSGL